MIDVKFPGGIRKCRMRTGKKRGREADFTNGLANFLDGRRVVVAGGEKDLRIDWQSRR